MCGIAGYVGDRESADVLVDALSKLEYLSLIHISEPTRRS